MMTHTSLWYYRGSKHSPRAWLIDGLRDLLAIFVRGDVSIPIPHRDFVFTPSWIVAWLGCIWVRRHVLPVEAVSVAISHFV